MRFLVAGLLLTLVWPQAPAPRALAFDAVSIKPLVPTGPWHREAQVNPKRLLLEGMYLEEMIEYAYDLHANQLVGMPAWTQQRAEIFQVSGVTNEAATPQQMKLMLQRVLAERFQFAFTETDTVQPVYGLVVAKGGLKIKP